MSMRRPSTDHHPRTDTAIRRPVTTHVRKDIEMYTLHEALAREHLREFARDAQQHALTRRLASANRWHRLERRVHAASRAHARRAHRAAQVSAH
jgi:hypothetical protein